MGIKSKLTRVIGRQVFKVRHNSPHILFVGGVVGVVGATVLACRATLRLEDVIVGMETDIDGIKQREVVADDRHPRHDQKDLAYAYAKGGFELVKLYGPAVAVGGVSIMALTGAHVQLTRRNTALTVAYTTLHQAYNEYRARVREHVGEDTERDLYFGVETEKGEKGKKGIKTIDVNKLSAYARFFDESSPNWQKNSELNRLFIQCQQNYANQLLQARGHVFLNEVYDMLGIDRSQAGQVVGWVINSDGDNFVDFGLFEPANTRFVNGWERSVLLDFNVDGIIYDKI